MFQWILVDHMRPQHTRRAIRSRLQPSRATVADTALISSVPVFLVAIHFSVPPAIQENLALNYGRIGFHAFLTSAYVHFTDTHFLSNVVTYILATVFAYQLCRLEGKRRWFHRTWVVLLIVLPVLESLTTYAVVSSLIPAASPAVRGFSAVAAGFVGFVFTATLVHLSARYSLSSVQFIGEAFILGLVYVLALIYGAGTRPLVVGLVAGTIALCGVMILIHGSWPESREGWRERVVHGGFIILVFIILALFMTILFPAQVVRDGSSVNILAHGIGFVYGVLLAGIVYLLDNGIPIRLSDPAS